MDLSVDELRTPSPKTVASVPQIDSSENSTHASQRNIARESEEETELKNSSSDGLKRPFADISNDNWRLFYRNKSDCAEKNLLVSFFFMELLLLFLSIISKFSRIWVNEPDNFHFFEMYSKPSG